MAAVAFAAVERKLRRLIFFDVFTNLSTLFRHAYTAHAFTSVFRARYLVMQWHLHCTVYNKLAVESDVPSKISAAAHTRKPALYILQT